MLRKLGIFERAMLISNKHAPFNIVSVLRLQDAPTPEAIKDALTQLQQRQPFLQVCITETGKRPFFEKLPNLEFPFKLIERENDRHWREIVEQEAALHFDHQHAPLFRATYLYQGGYGDLVLNVHHTIMDAASGMNLLDELLRICAGEITDRPPLQFAPVFETVFPPSHQGLRRTLATAGYALVQTAEMAKFTWRTRNKRTPPLNLEGKGHIATMIIPKDMVDMLARQGRKRAITLNSILNAALILAVNRHLYEGEALPMQTFSFADLRPYTIPPAGPEPLANYISMMRFTVDAAGEIGFWKLAVDLHGQIYRALKSGDKFSAALMSESLLKMFTTMKSMRFCATAVNYSGNVPLKTQYGEINVVGLHGFVSAYNLGPELASQARLFNDEIWWDFMYLDSDMDAALAESILAEIMSILEKAGKNQG